MTKETRSLAFGWSEEIFRHNIAELAIRNILNIIGCDVGNLSESVIPCQRLFFTVKCGFILIIGLSVCFMGSAVLIGHISSAVLFFRLNHKLKTGFFGKRLQYFFPDVFHIGEVAGNVIGNGFRNLILPDNVLIDTYSSDYIKSMTDSKYGKGASDYIVKAFRYYSENNASENN